MIIITMKRIRRQYRRAYAQGRVADGTKVPGVRAFARKLFAPEWGESRTPVSPKLARILFTTGGAR